MAVRLKRFLFVFGAILMLGSVSVYAVLAWDALAVADDPLVRMPGTQPGQVSLENPNNCVVCHFNYDLAVEPGYNWQGSMMAQAARDFLFWACMTVAAQDSIWAVGRPNAVDICERCHFPMGWLEGRSDPPNASAMTGYDYDGVQCDFCHSMYDPFFETTHNGTREGADWANYWDEAGNTGPGSGTLSQDEAETTYLQDEVLAGSETLFNGNPFFTNNLPPANYSENAAGQYYVGVDPQGQKRASFADAGAKHKMFYSRYHKSKYFCSSCHDVSNPVLANLAFDGTPPGDGSTLLPTELQSASSYYHVERTFSEFMLSAYGTQGGSAGIGPYEPGTFQTSMANNHIARCQDCHLPDVSGTGADKTSALLRTGNPLTTESSEHPYSGQPQHDMTGGNAWVSYVLASAIPGSPNYDLVNDQLLNQGASTLTLDLSEGLGINPEALLAGADRAKAQLTRAASIQETSYNKSTGSLSFRIQNQTGHKLISGFPEGRRMFVNIKLHQAGEVIYEINPYSDTVGTLKGLDHEYSPDSPPLDAGEVYIDELVYEMHPSSSLTGEEQTFHFALADGRFKDNRIPPKGFDYTNAATRLSEPVWEGASAVDYFTPAEYAGGYDEVELTVPTNADWVEINLYYQTTSREYIAFLHDEIEGEADTLSSPTPSGEANAYIIQSDPFFSQLRAWGDTIWELWEHNMNLPGAKPFLMAQAYINTPPGAFGKSSPTNGTSAQPTSLSLIWDTSPGADSYEYCYETSDNDICDGSWIDVGVSTSAFLSGLSEGTTYYWQVMAVNTSGSTEADADAWWSFTTQGMEIYLPMVIR